MSDASHRERGVPYIHWAATPHCCLTIRGLCRHCQRLCLRRHRAASAAGALCQSQLLLFWTNLKATRT
jgi:hypothetical protein